MTKNQITTILGTMNLTAGTVVDLKDISSIVLQNNSSIYPTSDYRYKFDNSKELLLEYVVRGTSNVLVTVYDYALINGFIMVNKYHVKGGYAMGRTC